MKVNKESMVLYAVTDRSWLKGETLYSQVESALEGGATFIQLREKDLSYEDFVEEAKLIKTLTAKYKVPFVINDNVDVAIAIDADGVHIGQDDEALQEARRRLGYDKIIGISAHTLEEALNAEKNGADYLGVGAVFTTSTKTDAELVSHEELSNICSNSKIPVVAIGGIYKENILKLKNTGINGVALISAIFAQDNIKAATSDLLKLSKEISNK